LLDVIARHQRKLDTANGVTRAIVVLFGRRLLANVGRLGDDRGSRRLGGGSDRGGGSGRARMDAGDWGLGRTGVVGLVLVEALALAAGLVALAVAVTVLFDSSTPVAELQAVEGGGKAGVLPAGGDQFRARLPGVQTAITMFKVGERRGTPLSNLVLALGGWGDCGGAQCRGSGGG
jgi:hypothetical protein